ncbi:MAG: AMP-binding protein, partial [Proteobacteria bacterium]|nr:AMP-binding protein [Pseudomonadota bacterium]
FTPTRKDNTHRYRGRVLHRELQLEMAVATYAVHAAGAQVVPLNPTYTERELGHILGDACPHIAIAAPEVAETVFEMEAEFGLAKTIVAGGATGRRFDEWRDDAGAVLPQPLPAPDDWASLQYTGGTTGLPKGANSTHRQMATNISQCETLLPTRPGKERILCVMPLFHCFAVGTGLHPAAYARSTLVILPRYHPGDVIEAIETHAITRLPAGPTVFIGLMNYDGFEQADLSSLRYCVSGSAPLAAETLLRWEAATGCPILEGYGQTEAGPVVSFNPYDGTAKPGSVGVALPGTEIDIVDVDSGTQSLGVGERGEIRVRGPQIMSGYHNRPEENVAALRNGWLYTGDIGERDADGYLFIRDRKKDMVIVGGYNVYPREIDEVLYTHPAVLEAAAVGVADDYRGEVIHAFIVLKPNAQTDTEQILEHCRSNLAKYKLPSLVRFVAALPKTSVGKIDKKTLRATGHEPAVRETIPRR